MQTQILQEKNNNLIRDIKRLGTNLDELAKKFRNSSSSFDEWSEHEWCNNAFGNALIRLRQLTEQNFNNIETISLLAVTRYIFELSIWLNLLKEDSKYGLVYYWKLLETQFRYYKDTVRHLYREVKLLKEFEKKDKQSTDKILKKINENKNLNSEIFNLLRESMTEVDAEAGRKFSIFIDDAKINGYGFQAYLVEKKSIPKIEQAIREIENKLKGFKTRVPEEIDSIIPKRWNWKQMAEKVGKGEEYDYIYTYASKLLHATPISLTTDQKNLEIQEILIFLRYIYIALLELIDLSRQQLKNNSIA